MLLRACLTRAFEQFTPFATQTESINGGGAYQADAGDSIAGASFARASNVGASCISA